MIRGKLIAGDVHAFRTGYMGDAVNYRLTIEFAYTTSTAEHRGEYTHNFRSEAAARQLLKSLEHGPLYVRYNPESPSDYTLDPYRDVWASGLHSEGR
jgi:hypothetical protein